MSQEQKDKQELQFKVEESEQQLAADILATKRSLAKANKELLQAKSAYPFDSKKIINAQLEVEGLEDGLSRLVNLQQELF
jgi:multidrug efflux pump subunit AcrA (membrane-fusion protein)